MKKLILYAADGSPPEEHDYDGLILPPSYIKILQGDVATCIHESLIPRMTLHGLSPDDFESLE